MKSFSILLLLFAIGFPISSCHRNRLKTNEKKLAQEIIIQEKEKSEAERTALEKELADTLNKRHAGARFKEDRSVDQANPPVEIDIAGNFQNIREFKLSDIASDIEYVRMEKVPDSLFSIEMRFRYYLFPDYIVATSPAGIILYSRGGKYISTIVKNKTTGITITAGRMHVIGTNTFIGGNTSVWQSENGFKYRYSNNINGQEYFLDYNLEKKQMQMPQNYETEDPDKVLGLGEVAVDMNPAMKKPVWKSKVPPELVSWSMQPNYIYQSVGTFLLNKNIYAKELERTDKVAVINNDGDTLSFFTGFENGETLRLESEGKQYLWSGRNDTIFQVSPPDRLVPVYVFNLGRYKWIRPGGAANYNPDYTGKIIPRGWAENKKFVFLILDKDGIDSPASIKSKNVKIYHALYSKLDRQLYILKGDPLNYSDEILENNLDGGMPVWPLSYMIGYNNEILISLKGKELKERVRSEQFKLSKAPEAKKTDLKKLAGLVSDNEDILMIIK
jgi:hypothetical protein